MLLKLETAIKAAAAITGATKELQRNKALAIVAVLVKAGAEVTDACTLAAAPLDAAGKNALMRRGPASASLLNRSHILVFIISLVLEMLKLLMV